MPYTDQQGFSRAVHTQREFYVGNLMIRQDVSWAKSKCTYTIVLKQYLMNILNSPTQDWNMIIDIGLDWLLYLSCQLKCLLPLYFWFYKPFDSWPIPYTYQWIKSPWLWLGLTACEWSKQGQKYHNHLTVRYSVVHHSEQLNELFIKFTCWFIKDNFNVAHQDWNGKLVDKLNNRFYFIH